MSLRARGPAGHAENSTQYSQVRSGSLGEAEFFTGKRYACGAVVTSEAVLVLQISTVRFHELLLEFDLQVAALPSLKK